MKKIAIAAAIVTALLTVQANYCSAAVNTGDSYSVFQFSTFPGAGNWPRGNNVKGLRLGVPISNSDEGKEANVANYNSFVYGVDLGLCSQSDNVKGLQMTFLNMDNYDCSGVQFGGTNVSHESFTGLQFGGFNEYDNAKGMQFGIFNNGESNCQDLQMGVINNHNMGATGGQIGVCNTAEDYKGFQFGVINISFEKKSDTFQIGLLNFSDSGFLPCCPFVNFN